MNIELMVEEFGAKWNEFFAFIFSQILPKSLGVRKIGFGLWRPNHVRGRRKIILDKTAGILLCTGMGRDADITSPGKCADVSQ